MIGWFKLLCCGGNKVFEREVVFPDGTHITILLKPEIIEKKNTKTSLIKPHPNSNSKPDTNSNFQNLKRRLLC